MSCSPEDELEFIGQRERGGAGKNRGFQCNEGRENSDTLGSTSMQEPAWEGPARQTWNKFIHYINCIIINNFINYEPKIFSLVKTRTSLIIKKELGTELHPHLSPAIVVVLCHL